MKVSEVKLSKPKRFILTLYDMMNNPEISDIITWTESGKAFAILNQAELVSKVLPSYFKHKNAASFIRQLNMYGFHKMRDTGEVLVYSHPNFIQSNTEKLLKLNRKTSQVGSRTKEIRVLKRNLFQKKHKELKEKVKEMEKQFEEVTNSNKELANQIGQCLKRQNELEQEVSGMMQQAKDLPNYLQSFYCGVMLARANNGDPSSFPQLFRYGL